MNRPAGPIRNCVRGKTEPLIAFYFFEIPALASHGPRHAKRLGVRLSPAAFDRPDLRWPSKTSSGSLRLFPGPVSTARSFVRSAMFIDALINTRALARWTNALRLAELFQQFLASLEGIEPAFSRKILETIPGIRRGFSTPLKQRVNEIRGAQRSARPALFNEF